MKTRGGGTRYLDAFGDAAVNNMYLGSGGSWTARHDEIEMRIKKLGLEHGLNLNCEVYGLFAAYVTQRNGQAADTIRKRQVMIPDFHITPTDSSAFLADVKVIGAGPSRYRSSDLRKKSGAVNRREGLVHNEYYKKARESDQEYNDTPVGTVGPIETRLAAFGRIHGLCFGAFSEASDDVSTLVDMMAASGAELMWRDMGARTKTEAMGIIKHSLVVELGTVAARAMARCKLLRVGLYASGDSQAAAARRQAHDAADFRQRAMYANRNGYTQSRPRRAGSGGGYMSCE